MNRVLLIEDEAAVAKGRRSGFRSSYQPIQFVSVESYYDGAVEIDDRYAHLPGLVHHLPGLPLIPGNIIVIELDASLSKIIFHLRTV